MRVLLTIAFVLSVFPRGEAPPVALRTEGHVQRVAVRHPLGPGGVVVAEVWLRPGRAEAGLDVPRRDGGVLELACVDLACRSLREGSFVRLRCTPAPAWRPRLGTRCVVEPDATAGLGRPAQGFARAPGAPPG